MELCGILCKEGEKELAMKSLHMEFMRNDEKN